jgi:hypothetical protein
MQSHQIGSHQGQRLVNFFQGGGSGSFLVDLEEIEEADLVDGPRLIQDHEACAVHLPIAAQDVARRLAHSLTSHT